MRTRVLIFFTLVLSLFFISSGFMQQSTEQLLQSAIYEEEVTGDLEKAIALYNKVLEAADDESLAAKAQLQIGICYEKLGKTEAIKAYELVLEKFPGQKEQAAVARARLAELKKEEPEGFMVNKLEFPVGDAFGLSPDGTKILSVRFRKGQNIVVYDIETKKSKFITDYDWGEASSWTYNPVWSPNGKKIAYNASCWEKEGSCGNSLNVATLDGETHILLSSEMNWFHPNAWLPDGSAILTIRGKPDNSQELGLVPSEGGEFKKLISLQGNVGSPGRDRASACVSPDGRFIAYKDIVPGEKSDIFIMSSEGGTSWPLIKHPATDGYPRWSPDGKHIVFQSLRHGSPALWGVAVEDGKAAGDPFLIGEGMGGILNWTSNGLASWNWNRIFEIYLMDVDPQTGEPVGKPRHLEYTPTGKNLLATWAPDGDRLAFFRVDINIGRAYLIIMKADGGIAQEYQAPREASRIRGGYLRWMPDGGGIGINGRNNKGENTIFSFRLDTEKWEEIPIPVNSEEGWTRFEWSGNNKAFLYSKNGYADQGAGIYEHDLETGKNRYVYRPKDNSGVNFRGLKCSRDYKWLTFIEANTNIVVVNLETGESHLAAKDVGPPSWDPDGQKIMAPRAYGGNQELNKSLFVFPAAGGSVKEFDLTKSLPKESRIRTPDWSPDGRRIVFELTQDKSEVLLYKNVIPKEKK